MTEDYKKIHALISDAKNKIFNPSKWSESLPLSECASNENSKEKSGIYLIFHPDLGTLYIGKGVNIRDRLKSHYKAVSGKETLKHPAWKQFFEYFSVDQKVLKAIYFEVNNYENNEHARQLLERIIQFYDKPLFNEVYTRGHKELIDKDLKIKIRERQNSYRTNKVTHWISSSAK